MFGGFPQFLLPGKMVGMNRLSHPDWVKICVDPNAPNKNTKFFLLQKLWFRIHLDYAETCERKIFLIIVDAYYKWLDVHSMNTATSSATIGKLRRTFAEHGLSNHCATDNATCFTNSDFQEFMTNKGIKHITPAPFHPIMNGQAERIVRCFKDSFENKKERDFETWVCKILLQYRTTPRKTTGLSPTEFLMKRKLTTSLNRVHPDLQLGM